MAAEPERSGQVECDLLGVGSAAGGLSAARPAAGVTRGEGDGEAARPGAA